MDILTLVFGIFAVSFAAAYIRSVIRLRNMSESFAKVLIAYTELEDKSINYSDFDINKQEIDVHTQNFIKFLSDSRDWAYKYIEDVQDGLKNFIEKVEPDINYYDKYGVVLEGMIAPHDEALKNISIEVKNLKRFLPEEIND